MDKYQIDETDPQTVSEEPPAEQAASAQWQPDARFQNRPRRRLRMWLTCAGCKPFCDAGCEADGYKAGHAANSSSRIKDQGSAGHKENALDFEKKFLSAPIPIGHWWE